jgi:hypothetical protein
MSMNRTFAPLLLATLLLAACSKAGAPASGANAPANASPASTAASDAAAPAAPATMVAPIPGEPPLPELGDFRIVQVLMGVALDDGHVVVHDTRVFAAKDPIHASVLSIGAHQGLKLSADWRAPDGSIIAKSEQALVPESDLATTFNLRNPEPWPAGDYELRLAIDGHTVRTEKFAIR